MRILKSRALEECWKSKGGEWDRALGGLVLSPRLTALVESVSPQFSAFSALDMAGYIDDVDDADATFLHAVKAALTLASRLETAGAFRVVVRRDVGAPGPRVTLRCFARDASHPRTPDDVDSDQSAWVLFVDTRRIDGARRAF